MAPRSAGGDMWDKKVGDLCVSPLGAALAWIESVMKMLLIIGVYVAAS